jgi:glycosyltransferase involved in cell wall biosynthesis
VSLTILNVAYPFSLVGSAAVGGAEQILGYLDRALVRAGHRSIVVASEGSTTAGCLVSVANESGVLDDPAKERAWQNHRRAIAMALESWPIDLVHLHGFDFHAYLPPVGVSTLVTLHLPPEWYPPVALRPTRAGLWFNCVSKSQHDRCAEVAGFLPPIANGVPIDALAARHGRRSFALVLGRICPEKGIHIAMDAARHADIPLLVGGHTFRYPTHESYFRKEIEPRLDPLRRLLGPLDFRRKRRFLSAARCLLLPSLAPETSSLVAMEAMACGTPVITFPNGALPEIVEHGRTGFLVRDVGEMAEAIHAVSEIDPEDCRAVARERFSLDRMTRAYFGVYRNLAGKGGRPAFEGAA